MDYTVVGYWADNGQPWVGFARGPDQKKAVASLVAQLSVDPDYEPIDTLVILEAFEGQHPGILGLEEGVSALNLIKTGPLEWSPRQSKRTQ